MQELISEEVCHNSVLHPLPAVYKAPYLLAFCDSALEVYEVTTGKWIQTLPFRKVIIYSVVNDSVIIYSVVNDSVIIYSVVECNVMIYSVVNDIVCDDDVACSRLHTRYSLNTPFLTIHSGGMVV